DEVVDGSGRDLREGLAGKAAHGGVDHDGRTVGNGFALDGGSRRVRQVGRGRCLGVGRWNGKGECEERVGSEQRHVSQGTEPWRGRARRLPLSPKTAGRGAGSEYLAEQ